MRKLGQFSLFILFLTIVPIGLGTPIGYLLTGMPKPGDYKRVLLFRIVSFVIGFGIMLGLTLGLSHETQLEFINFIEGRGLIFTVLYLVLGVILNQVVVSSTIKELKNL